MGGSLKTGPFGTTLKAAEYAADGAPVVSVGEIGDGYLRIRSETPKVGADVCERLSEYLLEAGDIVFARKGAVERTAWVREEEHGYFLGSDGLRLRVGDGVHSRYLSFALRSAGVRQWLLQHAGGSTLLSLNQSTLQRVPVPLPDLATQTAIADVLGALDDKIAANERVLERNLRLRGAIFESLHKPLSVPMSDLARFVNGRNFTKDATGNGRPVIRIAELNNGVTASTVWNDVQAVENNVARAGDILFAWSGSLTVTRWSGVEGLVNQHIFKVMPNGLPDWLVFHLLLLKLADYKSIAADKATTMGHIQRGHLDQPVALPTETEIARVNGLMTALWSAELSLRIENARLAATRDALLPELMTGRLTVSIAVAAAR